jgi:hypothetical protein
VTLEQAESVIALAHEQGFTLHKAVGLALRGLALAKLGRKEQGIAQIREGLDAAHAAGDMVWSPSLLTVLATAYGEAGQPEEGL